MRMIESLLQIAPNTTRQFVDSIMFSYGMNEKEFESKDLTRRFIEIRKFFGYSMTVPAEMSQEEIKKEIKFLFEDFEQLMIKYPDGVPNFLQMLKFMGNDEKGKYIEKHYKRIINISLCHALVKRTVFNIPSLKDALVARVMSQIEQIGSERAKKEAQELKFWKETIKNFYKDEIVPF